MSRRDHLSRVVLVALAAVIVLSLGLDGVI